MPKKSVADKKLLAGIELVLPPESPLKKESPRKRGRPPKYKTQEEKQQAKKAERLEKKIKGYKTHIFNNVHDLVLSGWNEDRILTFVKAVIRLGLKPSLKERENESE